MNVLRGGVAGLRVLGAWQGELAGHYEVSTLGGDDYLHTAQLTVAGARRWSDNARLRLRHRYAQIDARNPGYEQLSGWRQQFDAQNRWGSDGRNMLVAYQFGSTTVPICRSAPDFTSYSPTRHQIRFERRDRARIEMDRGRRAGRAHQPLRRCGSLERHSAGHAPGRSAAAKAARAPAVGVRLGSRAGIRLYLQRVEHRPLRLPPQPGPVRGQRPVVGADAREILSTCRIVGILLAAGRGHPLRRAEAAGATPRWQAARCRGGAQPVLRGAGGRGGGASRRSRTGAGTDRRRCAGGCVRRGRGRHGGEFRRRGGRGCRRRWLGDRPGRHALYKSGQYRLAGSGAGRRCRAGGALHRGQRGHPVGFSAEFAPALRALQGDRGARDLLARHADRLQCLEVDDPGVLLDVDTPADLAMITR
ncbi:MAG: NTP transferase domain-containing protein [Chromatiales bacterium]|nr:NTP transferase domain-containing protein [Chromatiales bacterium]